MTQTSSAPAHAAPPMGTTMLRPGLRLALAVSGGADSVALLRACVLEQARLGLVLTVVHVHHGIRGAAADDDARFVEELARALELRFLRHDVHSPAMAAEARANLEETARNQRYRWFAELVAAGVCDSVATAHTLNDQAETVLAKLLRGAWTEGLAGIYPELAAAGAQQPSQRAPLGAGAERDAAILRPLLGATREQVVAWLTAIGQPWREDATNADLSYTRNRIRHRLLPELATFNPKITKQLAQLAEVARDEEAFWQAEVSRLLPGLLLPGRAVRGGGRASSTLPGARSLAIEVERLRGLSPALLRRLLRAAARELGVALDFAETARLLALVLGRGSANPRREEFGPLLRAERTPRELRLIVHAAGVAATQPADCAPVHLPVPGEAVWGDLMIRCSFAPGFVPEVPHAQALLRAAQPSDRVQLRHSRGTPKRVKEVLERAGVPPGDRDRWPVLEWQGELVWMRGAALEPSSAAAGQLIVTAEEDKQAAQASGQGTVSGST